MIMIIKWPNDEQLNLETAMTRHVITGLESLISEPPETISGRRLALLANPASVFGHALLKLNTDQADDRAGLFDLTVNYGALVPENESAVQYIINGIICLRSD